MPNYKYTAQDADGRKKRGRAEANSREALHLLLKEENLFLLSAEEIHTRKRVKMLKPRQCSDFSRQIGTLVGSGVSLVRALSIISQQEDIKAAERNAYTEVLRSVRSGIPLSDSMENLNGVFPSLMISMYRSAEAGGNLDRVALQMAVHYDKEWRLNSKVNSAMLYPKILGVLIVAVVMGLTGFVLPQFDEMFSQMESLPLPTTVLMAISGFVSRFWYLIVAAAVAVVVIIRSVLAVPKYRIKWDRTLVHLPKIGYLEKVIFTSRFARSLASLYCSGLPIVSSLNIARHTTGNLYIDSQFDEVVTFLRGGGNLSEGLGKIDGFVNKLEFSVRVGEETGSLDSMLESTADSMEYESEMALQRMVGILEPGMIVLMALIVGFVMIAVIVPIYDSYSVIGAGA